MFPKQLLNPASCPIKRVYGVVFPRSGSAIFKDVSGGEVVGVHDFEPEHSSGASVCEQCSFPALALGNPVVTHAAGAVCPNIPSDRALTIIDRSDVPDPDPNRPGRQGPQYRKKIKPKIKQYYSVAEGPSQFN